MCWDSFGTLTTPLGPSLAFQSWLRAQLGGETVVATVVLNKLFNAVLITRHNSTLVIETSPIALGTGFSAGFHPSFLAKFFQNWFLKPRTRTFTSVAYDGLFCHRVPNGSTFLAHFYSSWVLPRGTQTLPSKGIRRRHARLEIPKIFLVQAP